MAATKRTSVRVRLVAMLFVISAIAFLDRTNISVAGLQMRRDYAIDPIQLGWVFSAFLIGYAAFQIPAGWLAARIGPRLLLTLALLWWGVFSVATAWVPAGSAHAITLLILVRFGLGIGEAAVYPSGNQFVSRWVPAQERGKANGLIFAGVGAGSGLTPPLISAVIAFGGWRASFYVCALIGVVAAAVWYVMARDRPQDHPKVDAAELAHIEAGLPHEPDEPVGPIPWRAILTSRAVWGLFLGYFAFGYVVWIFFSWFFIYLAEARGLDLKASALFGMAPFVAMTIGCLVGGVVNDWVSRRHGLYWGRSGLAMLSFALTALFLLIGSQVASAPLAVLTLALGGGAMYLSQSSFWSVTADIAGRHTGVVSGLMNVGCQLGGALTASLTPWIAARHGWAAAFGTGAAVVLVGIAAWAAVDPRRLIGGARAATLDPALAAR
jgi:MFS transporter, ACS family, glucarate transporter